MVFKVQIEIKQEDFCTRGKEKKSTSKNVTQYKLGISNHITLCCISLRRCCFGLETRIIIKFLTHPCYPINVDWFSLGWSKNKFKMADSKKLRFLTPPILIFFPGIGPLVRTINWCKGHQCGSTYMVVRLYGVSSKRAKNAFFELRLDSLKSICWATFMPFASIYSTNPKTNH